MSHRKLIPQLAAALLIAAGSIGPSLAADTPASPKAATPSETVAAPTDSTITTKVKSALKNNKVSGISVKTEQGIVVLAGSAPTEEERFKIAKIAASVEGVRGVDYASINIKANS